MKMTHGGRRSLTLGLPLLTAFGSVSVSALIVAEPTSNIGSKFSRDATFDVLVSRAQRTGTVRVIARLRSEPVATEPRAVDSAHRRMIDRLAKSSRSLSRFESLPLVGMVADASDLTALRANPDVVSVFEDFQLDASLAESVTITGANATHVQGYSGAGQTIAVLDTGFDGSHPDLSGKLVAEACFSTEWEEKQIATACPNGRTEQYGQGAAASCSGEGCDHGTHVAGIAAGRRGIARDASVMAVQVFSLNGSASGCARFGKRAPCTTAWAVDILRGLDYVAGLADKLNVAAVNLSLGSGASARTCDDDAGMEEFNEAFSRLRKAGAVTIAASGNSWDSDGISFPSCLSGTVSVGATDKSDQVAAFSNSAGILDLLAPGVGIESAVPGKTRASKDGTSMAAPHVAGAWTVLRQAMPNADTADVYDALVTTGEPVTDYRNGVTRARIRIDRALQILSSPSGLHEDWPLGGFPEPAGVRGQREARGPEMLPDAGGLR